MEKLPQCPQCNFEHTYEFNDNIVCPNCSYEWQLQQSSNNEEVIKDSNGNVLTEGDSIIIIKDLKVKGILQAIKQGTKVKNIRLIYNSADGHDIDCKIDGFGAMKLKSEFVKKA